MPVFSHGIGCWPSDREACVHPDHIAAAAIVKAAVFLARLGRWDQVPGGEQLAAQEVWAVPRIFFLHCKVEAAWGDDIAFAVDVSDVYERKRKALAAYTSIFAGEGDRLLALIRGGGPVFRPATRSRLRRDSGPPARSCSTTVR